MVLTYIQCRYFSLGFLKKLRKEGKIYLGSKYQKRYCVVRNHIFYYYREKKLHKQAGHILLPGYKAQVSNKKGREFTLTHSDGYRTYQVTYTVEPLLSGHLLLGGHLSKSRKYCQYKYENKTFI